MIKDKLKFKGFAYSCRQDHQKAVKQGRRFKHLNCFVFSIACETTTKTDFQDLALATFTSPCERPPS